MEEKEDNGSREIFEHYDSNYDKNENSNIVDKGADKFSQFICTVYKIAYFLVFYIDIILLLVSTQFFDINPQIIYCITLVFIVITMWIVYKLSKNRKERRGELEVRQLSIGKKAIFCLCSLLVGVASSMTAVAVSFQAGFRFRDELLNSNKPIETEEYHDDVNPLAGDTYWYEQFEDEEMVEEQEN